MTTKVTYAAKSGDTTFRIPTQKASVQSVNVSGVGNVSFTDVGDGVVVSALGADATVTISLNEVADQALSRISTGAAGVIKASAGKMTNFVLLNTNAATRYFQVYDKATAGVPGTDTPVYTVPIATGKTVDPGQSISVAGSSGLSWAVTTDAAGATAGSSGDIVGTVRYN
jgi:hypothetical protein